MAGTRPYRAGAEGGAAAVILLTDGMHNAGVHTPLESAERARALKVPVYTLGFGEKVDLDENVLANVASVTGGVYVYAPSPEDLRRIYTQLSGYISGHLVVQSLLQTLRQGEELSMTVPVERGQSYFSVRASYTGSSLSITAISPSGRVLNLMSSNVVYYREKGVEQLTVYYPESGEWKVLVKAVEAPSQGIDLAVSVLRPGFTARLRDEVLAVVPGGGNTHGGYGQGDVGVDAGTGSRPTPLRYAAGGGDPELVKMFWSADLDAQYNDGKKAAELARKKGHLEVRIP
ncbi:hypothetical protein [Infirmifilum uzonense]|uniref:vWA domain-containing protein n=1 Tax=Infirmifilum uzonense TaxID=1550241 RepID=UPI003C75E95B